MATFRSATSTASVDAQPYRRCDAKYRPEVDVKRPVNENRLLILRICLLTLEAFLLLASYTPSKSNKLAGALNDRRIEGLSLTLESKD